MPLILKIYLEDSPVPPPQWGHWPETQSVPLKCSRQEKRAPKDEAAQAGTPWPQTQVLLTHGDSAPDSNHLDK